MADSQTSYRMGEPEQGGADTGKPRKHRDWSGALFGLLIGCAVLAMGRLGQLWLRFDVFSQFSVQAMLLIVACGAGLLSPRLKSLAAGVLFVLLIAGYGLWAHLATPGAEKALDGGEKALKVVQFNVHSSGSDADAVTSAITALDPDVMTLVEFDQRSAKVLDALKARWPYQATCWQEGGCDMAILSKFPLSNIAGSDSWEGPPYIMATLPRELGDITVVGVHTTRFPHLDHQYSQIKALIALLEGYPGKMLLMGDFNATPFSRVTGMLSQSLDLKILTSLPTWPATYSLPQLSIDHIFVRGGMRPLTRESIGASGGSDHYPIMMTLGVPAASP